MGDAVIVLISACVGIATLVFSRLRSRYVTTYDSNGLETHVSACGFTDQVLVPEKVLEQVDVRPGAVLVVKKIKKGNASTTVFGKLGSGRPWAKRKGK